MGVAVCQRGRTVVWPRSCGVNYRCCHRRRPCPPQGQRAAVFGAIAAVSGALAVTVLLMFTAFFYCSPSSSKTWKGCADGLHDEDTLQALQRGKFIDDPNVFDLSRFDNKIIGLCLCRFDFCPDALTLLSTEQRSIRQFWHASRWGDEALGFISVIDVCHFVPQAFWRQNIGQQVRTSFCLAAHAPVVRSLVRGGRLHYWDICWRVSAAMGWPTQLIERPQNGHVCFYHANKAQQQQRHQ